MNAPLFSRSEHFMVIDRIQGTDFFSVEKDKKLSEIHHALDELTLAHDLGRRTGFRVILATPGSLDKKIKDGL